MEVKNRYEQWLNCVTDKQLKEELLNLNESEINARFYKELSFGTGGLRGVLGVGTACLNIYTVCKITEGVAKYIIDSGAIKKVAVSYDSRINSQVFAERVACTLASKGISVVLTPKLMPTPYLSFLTREEKCGVGVMITASHNPAEYNGYKVYGADGCQITDAVANEIASKIAISSYFGEDIPSLETCLENGSVVYSKQETEDRFINLIIDMKAFGIENISVAYTPLHGTGRELVPKLLTARNIGKLSLVEKQMPADGNFPTCPYPNPEKPEALTLGVEVAKNEDSDILIATDPDADRIGVAVKTSNGYQLLSGNETGALLCDYFLSVNKEKGTLPKNPVVVKTIVTSDLIKSIAEEYGAVTEEVLTGFKYIGEKIGELEKQGRKQDYILGLEESYGYLVHTFVRDKDAVSAAQAICEMTAYYKAQGKTLVEVLEGLYEKFGRFENKLLTFAYPGPEGAIKMRELTLNLRAQGISEIGGKPVVKKIDYKLDETGLPKSDVLSFSTADGEKVIIRPSGTEPQIKAYLFVKGNKQENQKRFEVIVNQLNDLLKYSK